MNHPFVVSLSNHESPVRGELVEPQAPFDKLPSTGSGRTEVFLNRELRLLQQLQEHFNQELHLLLQLLLQRRKPSMLQSQ